MNIWISKVEKAELTEQQVRQVARSYLLQKLGGHGIMDDKGKRWVYVWHDTHGSGHDELIREATDLDEALFKVLNSNDGPAPKEKSE